MSSTEVKDVIKQSISEAVNQKGRPYHKYVGISITFQDDDSKADRDAEAFEKIMKRLGDSFADFRRLDIPKAHWKPALLVHDMIYGLAQELGQMETSTRILVVLHYSGHARVKDGSLQFCAKENSPQAFGWGEIYSKLLSPAAGTLEEECFRRTDVIAILDSCYAGAAISRGMPFENRSVEIIAAVDANEKALGNPDSLARRQNVTFTSIFCTEIAKLIGQKAPAIRFESIVQLISKRKENLDMGRRPLYVHLKGEVPIRVPTYYQANQSPQSNTLISGDDWRVILTFHLAENCRGEAVQNLIDWIQLLDPKIGISLNGVYRHSASTLVIMDAPYHLGMLLCSHQGFTLVDDCIIGGNMLGGQRATLRDTKENVRPSEVK